MHIAGDTLSNDQLCEADVCVIGAGPTGIACALELIQAGVSVCLLESGDSEREATVARDQDRGQLPEGSKYYEPEIIRARAVGGTSTLWDAGVEPLNRGARYIPFDEVDFETRSSIPHSGWPISRQQLDPYYRRAQSYAGIGPYDYNISTWSGDTQPFQLDETLVRSGVFQFGSADTYYKLHRATLCSAESVKLYTRTTALELRATPGGERVNEVRARASGGAMLEVRARTVILAMGALENIRLLLCSQDSDPAGLGNRRGVVGRYFVDHPLVSAGAIVPRDPGFFEESQFYDWRSMSGTTVCGHLKLGAKTMRDEKVLGVGSMLVPRSDHSPLVGVQSARAVLSSFRDKRPPSASDVLRAPQAILEIPSILQRRKAESLGVNLPINRGGWSRMPSALPLIRSFDVVWATEQAPSPEHRVELSEEKDAFGTPRIRINWSWSELDQHCLKNAQEIFADAFSSAGFASFEPRRSDGELVMRAPTMHHPMGGTRMSSDPEQGVVDARCKVFDTENLFVAGGSVFPTGSFANPTLTMMATGVLAAESALSALGIVASPPDNQAGRE